MKTTINHRAKLAFSRLWQKHHEPRRKGGEPGLGSVSDPLGYASLEDIFLRGVKFAQRSAVKTTTNHARGWDRCK